MSEFKIKVFKYDLEEGPEITISDESVTLSDEDLIHFKSIIGSPIIDGFILKIPVANLERGYKSSITEKVVLFDDKEVLEFVKAELDVRIFNYRSKIKGSNMRLFNGRMRP